MKLKDTIFPVWAMIFALCGSVEAQQTGKVLRIGFLDGSTASGMAVLVDAFRQEVSKLGWVEGKNIAIEYRFAEQKPDRLPELASELVRRNVDLIVVSSGPGSKVGNYYNPCCNGERRRSDGRKYHC